MAIPLSLKSKLSQTVVVSLIFKAKMYTFEYSQESYGEQFSVKRHNKHSYSIFQPKWYQSTLLADVRENIMVAMIEKILEPSEVLEF